MPSKIEFIATEIHGRITAVHDVANNVETDLNAQILFLNNDGGTA